MTQLYFLQIGTAVKSLTNFLNAIVIGIEMSQLFPPYPVRQFLQPVKTEVDNLQQSQHPQISRNSLDLIVRYINLSQLRHITKTELYLFQHIVLQIQFH